MYDPSAIKSELANSISHGLGILFTIVATPVLISMTSPRANTELMFVVAFYCFTLLLMFTFSTLYHAFSNPIAKKILRVFDHISIFFLIGGTYAPFIVLYTPPQTAYYFFIIQWILIALGIVKKIFFTGQFRLLSSLIYIFIGCMVFFLGTDFWEQLPNKSIYLLVGGGASYLIGVIFYQNQKIPYNHFIWHLFVLLAAILHYFAVLVAI